MSTKPTQYYQCHLAMVRCPNIRTTGWIEAKGAIVGAKVEILPQGEFWEVLQVHGIEASKELVKDMEADYRAGMPSTRDTKKDKRKRVVTPTQEAADAVAKRINDQSNAREMARQSRHT